MKNCAAPESGRLGLFSGLGLVVADMIGAGVFLSAGFMAQQLGPVEILGAWAVGAVMALLGVLTYTLAAQRISASGGEYRYLSDLLHPAAGYLAGWTSLLLGFSAPLAIGALAAAAFAGTVWPGLPRLPVAAAIIVTLCALHAAGWRLSLRTQNLLAVFKVALILGFVTLGLALGDNRWPVWTPPQASEGFPLLAFSLSLFYVSFAFSGWNAAVYSSGEFRRPKDVALAMLIGCLAVAALYLVANWIFVANLSPEQAQAVFDYEDKRVTLGHLIMSQLMGGQGGKIFSLALVVVFLSSASTLMFLGPRVCAAMARDGFLPARLCRSDGGPAELAVVMQGTIALVLVLVYPLQKMLENLGALLTFFSALVALSVVKLAWRSGGRSRLFVVPALGYLAIAGWMFFFGVQQTPGVTVWLAGMVAAGLLAYALQRAFNHRRET